MNSGEQRSLPQLICNVNAAFGRPNTISACRIFLIAYIASSVPQRDAPGRVGRIGRLKKDASHMEIDAFRSTGQATPGAAHDLKVGVGVTVINPSLDVPLAGYYYPRNPGGVHDDLHAKALLIDNGQARIVLVACDLVRLARAAVEDARCRIQKSLGIPPDHFLITATHSHTGPQLVPKYVEKLGGWIADSVEAAMDNTQPARLFHAVAEEPSLPHNRRYRMKDGIVATNPGFLNSRVVSPVGPVDPRLAVLTAQTPQGRRMLTWVNYALHQDTTGGDRISADYSGFMARDLAASEGAEMATIFTIGAAADINHWDVHQPGPQRGYATAGHIGEVLASRVREAYAHLSAVDSTPIHALASTLNLRFQKVSASDVEKAERILSTPPPPGIDFTLDRVWAAKVIKIRQSKTPELKAEVQVLTLGSLAFVGIPGELFVQLGMEIVRRSPFPNTFILELANQDIGYIPTKEAFEQGAYEPTSSVVAPGTGERIVDEALALLNQCRQ